MKYVVEILINRPIDEVIVDFKKEEFMYKSMPTLDKIKRIDDTHNVLYFNKGSKLMKMDEEIVVDNLPTKFETIYTVDNVTNYCSSSFHKVDDMSTKYVMSTRFEFSGLIKFIAPMMKYMFKKETVKQLNSFKDALEEMKV